MRAYVELLHCIGRSVAISAADQGRRSALLHKENRSTRGTGRTEFEGRNSLGSPESAVQLARTVSTLADGQPGWELQMGWKQKLMRTVDRRYVKIILRSRLMIMHAPSKNKRADCASPPAYPALPFSRSSRLCASQ